jgi:hypothetical protein
MRFWLLRACAACFSGGFAASGAHVETAFSVPAMGHVGFTAIDAVSAGIGFTNHLTPEAIVRNQNFMNGSGVALGDIDGDGRCDLYFPAIDGTNRLYRNLGGWRFAEIAAEAGVGLPGAHSTGAVLEDLDGDGDLDLIVTTMGGGPKCLLNDGKGRFVDSTPQSGLASATGSTTTAIADVDGNGTLDLYVANYGSFPILRSGLGKAQVRQVNGQWIVEGPHANRLRVVNQQIEEVGEPGVLYLNDGNARFQAVPWGSDRFVDEKGQPRPAPPDFGLSAMFRDVNGDGHPDLYACNDFQTPDRLWLNQGDGRFREVPRLMIRKFAFSSMGVDFGDLDRDGQLDYFTVEMSPRSHARRQRSMTGVNFIPNLPGRFEYRPEVPRNTLYRGNGDGSWSELAEYAGVASTDWSWQPVFLDVDLDGFEDILIASGAIHDVQDRDTLAAIQSSGRPSQSATVLSYPAFPSPVSAFRNLGGFRFEDVHERWGFTRTNLFQTAVLADLDDDGDLDLVTSCLNASPGIYRNDASAPRISVRARGSGKNTRGVNARIRVRGGPVDQEQEIVSGGRYVGGDDAVRTFACGDAKSFEIEVRWRSGAVSRITNARPNHRYVVDEAIIDPAGARDTRPPSASPIFADVTGALGHTHREELFDDLARQPLLHRQLSAAGPMVAWVDFLGDGRQFLVVGSARGGKLGVYRARVGGGFEAIPCDWVAPDDLTGMTAWVDPDGRSVLLAAVSNHETAPAASSSLVVLRMVATEGNLRGVVEPWPHVPAVTAPISRVASADFDGDGQLDLFVGSHAIPGFYPKPGPSRLFRGTNGIVTPEAVRVAGLDSVGLVQGVAWTDLDGDGDPELVTSSEWGPIRIFRNQTGQLESWDPSVRVDGGSPVSLSRMSGWWTGVAPGDFDGDGRMDLVVGNWGLNTGYEATPERPLKLYHGAVGGGEFHDLIEAYHPLDMPGEVARRGRRALSMAIPPLGERFATHAAFGEALMPSLLAALPTKPAVEAATELRSMLFLNRGESWDAIPLPREAQWSPVLGVSVTDVNADGFEDVLLSQNFFAMRIEWPRTDAGRGCVLLGDGRGGFRCLDGNESGVVVLGEGRGGAVADIDRDGKVDWVTTQNGAPTRVFRGVAPATGLRVRLKGGSRNPLAIGATVRLRGGQGLGPAREIHASSGYGSVDATTTLLAGDARAVWVRWPGGRTTETPVPPDAAEIEVVEP